MNRPRQLLASVSIGRRNQATRRSVRGFELSAMPSLRTMLAGMFACCLGAPWAKGADARTEGAATSAPPVASGLEATMPAPPTGPARAIEQTGTRQDESAVGPPSKATMTALLATLQEYNPPKLEATDGPAKTPPPDSPDVIRMRPLIVEGIRPPVFQEFELLSRRDLVAAAERRYLSDIDRFLNLFNLLSFPPGAGSKEARALGAYDDERQRKAITDFRRQANAADIAGDTQSAKTIRRAISEVTMREIDWGYRSRR